jgi:hypothetical protein
MPGGQFLTIAANIRETRRFRVDADMHAVPGLRPGRCAKSARDGRAGTVPSLRETVSVDVTRLGALPDGESQTPAPPSALAACPHAGPVPAPLSSSRIAGPIVIRDGGLDVGIVQLPKRSPSSSFCIRSIRQ